MKLTAAKRARKLAELTAKRLEIILDAEHEHLREYLYIRYDNYVMLYKNGKLCRFHRHIMQAEKSVEVDHINGNPLDNRLCNLRLATSSQNKLNTANRYTNTTSYRGVTKLKSGRFKATITVNYLTVSLGTYKTAEEAALAYNKAAEKYHGEFAQLNKVD